MLGEHLRHLEELDVAIQRVTDEIARRFKPPEPPCASESSPEEPSEGESAEHEQEASSHEPAELGWQEAVQRIDSVPGINERAAQGILTETGEAVAALSFGEALCLLGRSLSREQRKRGQATQRQDPQRQLPLASSLDPSGSCSSA